MERFPPMAAAKMRGRSRREREKPDFDAVPMTIGIKIAAVPVLERKPLMMPVTSMTATMSSRSVWANLVTMPPTRLAIPVSKKQPPITNIATKRIRLLSTKPPKASLGLRTPVRTRTRSAMMDVTASGIFSQTNITITNKSSANVMATGDIAIPPLDRIGAIGYILKYTFVFYI